MKLKLIKKPSTNISNKEEYYVNENNQFHGEFKAWWNDGKLFIYCYCKNGQRHGECKDWWGNGQLRTQSNYKNGKLHGEYKRWRYSGKLFEKSYYINGKEYSWNEYKRMKIRKILKKRKCQYSNSM